MGGLLPSDTTLTSLSPASLSRTSLASSLHLCPLQAQRQLLHEELKLVLQQKGEGKWEPGAPVTPSSTMEVRSRSAEVSVHTSSKGDLWGLGRGHRLGQQGDICSLLCAPISPSMKRK